MTRRPIKLHTANALQWLGSLYRDAADALKEHVSNAIDEHTIARGHGVALPICCVVFTLEKSAITVEYPYGMSKDEFEKAMDRVADSAKKELDISQIGTFGIGMFGFLQFATKCVLLSRKSTTHETIKATIRAGSDEYELGTATKKESLHSPGVKIIISELKQDPTKSRGPLSVAKLQRLFSERYGAPLRAGSLRILLRSDGSEYSVEPPPIDLPRIAAEYGKCYLRGSRDKTFRTELYFDSTGKGTVGIRHQSVVVVNDIRQLNAYELEESIYASGDVHGFVDADFLQPRPARMGFEENDDWTGLLAELEHIHSAIEAEVAKLKQEEAEQRLTEIQRQALTLAREILDTEEFDDLSLLDGSREPREPRKPPNGFDFVPCSLRLDPGQQRSIPLKACVPEKVADGTRVKFSISDPLAVRLLDDAGRLCESAADEQGVVTLSVRLEAKTLTMEPVVLTATAGELETRARINVARSIETRVRRAPGELSGGKSLNYVEIPFYAPIQRHHSGFDSSLGRVEVNDAHPHFKQAGQSQDKLAYAALMIGKETIAYNNPATNDHLEKLLSFYFELRNRLQGRAPSAIKRARGRPRKAI